MPAIRLFILALALCAFSVPANAGEKVRILFIGNSYTGQIKKTVTAMIKASPFGDSTELEFITPGGKTLEFHLEKETTVQKIADGNWDYVVLQDQSQTPAVFPQRFKEAAVGLDKLIDAAGAKTVFYQTWGRRDGDKQNAERFPTYESMQKALSDSYSRAARRCDGILAPVGDTWALVREVDAELGVALYKNDGSHPSAKGAYLAACVFYAALFGQSAEAIDVSATGVSSAEAAVIHQAIAKTIAR